MNLSIISDELGLDILDSVTYVKKWELDYIDLRNNMFGLPIHKLNERKLLELKELLNRFNLKVGCIQSSIGKKHLANKSEINRDVEAFENLLIASEILNCNLIRVFNYWRPTPESKKYGNLTGLYLEEICDMMSPIIATATDNDIFLAFENCGAPTRDIHTFLDAIDSPNCGLAWDICNNWDTEILEYKTIQGCVSKHLRKLFCLHIKSNGVLEEYKGQDTKIPVKQILRELKGRNFEGLISIETQFLKASKSLRNSGCIELNALLVNKIKSILR